MAFLKIENQAWELVCSNNIKEPSVPVKKIGEAMGLKIIPYNLGEGVSGTLVLNNSQGFIGYNPRESKSRQRFTIAHELGHYVLHRTPSARVFVDSDFFVKYRSERTYSSIETKQETEANVFAAAILMPEPFVLAELQKPANKKLGELELIEFLAKRFEVSVPAMTFRLNNIQG